MVQQLCIDTDILQISSEHILIHTLAANKENMITDIWFHNVNATSATQ